MLALLLSLLLTALSPALLQAEPARRAKPPEWTPEDLEVFFEDAREHLVGERPTAESLADATENPDREKAKQTFRWSSLIDADTLTAEVKRLHINLNSNLARPAKFKGGGNLQCRRDFSVLAVMFELISKYDKDVRWKSSAESMRQQTLQASEICSTGTDASYQSAQKVHNHLSDLLRGQTPNLDSSKPDEKFVAGFPQLMQRMEQALTGKISPSLASAREFRKVKQDVAHEAQVVAALAEIICREEYDFGEDETYLEFARTLRDSCESLGRAARDGNYEAARSATGNVTKSCSECHEGYRG